MRILGVAPFPSGFTPPSGAWQQPSNLLGGASAVAPTSGQISWVPIDIGPRPLTIQALGVQCGVAQVGGTTTLTLGLYADDGSGGQPLLSAAGLIGSGTFTASATGVRSVALSATLPPGRYWAAFLYRSTSAPSTAPTFIPMGNVSPALWIPSSAPNGLGAVSRALFLTGQTALPTTSQTLVPNTTNNAPVVCVQAA